MDDMQPRRGELEQLATALGKEKTTTTTSNGAAATCLCPDAALAPPDSSSRQALEKELLSRADLLQQQVGGGGGTGVWCSDRRKKNRASAERSRARKSAYLNDLETEVRILQQENEQLKRLYEELKESAEVAAKRTPTLLLKRTSSVPLV